MPSIGENLLTYLVGRDRDLAEELLDDGTVPLDKMTGVVAGQRNEILEEIGPLLLDRGVTPDEIAQLAGLPVSG
jgi:hypothetical protein